LAVGAQCGGGLGDRRAGVSEVDRPLARLSSKSALVIVAALTHFLTPWRILGDLE
jgi:hypothetical protein